MTWGRRASLNITGASPPGHALIETMAYKDPNAARMAARERQRRYRANKKKQAAPVASPPVEPVDADRLAEWSRSTLRVPPGHPLAGQPLELPLYGVDFLRDSLAVPESLLCVARKTAKSAIVAVFLLARLGWPAALPGLPGRRVLGEPGEGGRAVAAVRGDHCGQRPEGHPSPQEPAAPAQRHRAGGLPLGRRQRRAGSSGFDDAVYDELGLLKERDRELVNSMRTSVSARNGRFIGLSASRGTRRSPRRCWRAGEPAGLAVHHYAAPEGCSLDDEDAWRAANPGLQLGIKSMEYMRHQAVAGRWPPQRMRRHFRAFDLNQPQGVDQQPLVTGQDWEALLREPESLPDKAGPMILGVDLSSGYAMSAAVAYWPETQRLEGLCAFPSEPGLKARGDADGVGGLYERMASRGELLVTDGRTVNVAEFLHDPRSPSSERPPWSSATGWRLNELKDGLDGAGIPPGIVITRGMGWQDGSEDVRNFQRAVKESTGFARRCPWRWGAP